MKSSHNHKATINEHYRGKTEGVSKSIRRNPSGSYKQEFPQPFQR